MQSSNWETPLSPAVTVQVTRNSVASNTQQIAIASAASPSVFLNNYSTGVAWAPARYAATLRRSLLPGGNAPGSLALPRFTLRRDQVPGANTMTLQLRNSICPTQSAPPVTQG